jgi:ferritin
MEGEVMSELVIPRSHWGNEPGNEAFIPGWEKHLRRSIAEEPDPAARFSQWLTDQNTDGWALGVKLLFIEEPYLTWANQIEELIKKTELDLREQIAREILNPEE